MNNFRYGDFTKRSCEYPIEVRARIRENKSLKVVIGSNTYECILSVSPKIDELIKETLQIPENERKAFFKIERIIKGIPEDVLAERKAAGDTKSKDGYLHEGDYILWTNIDKTQISQGNTNSKGRAFINEVEKEAVHWLKKGEVEDKPKYIKNLSMWASWRNTFSELVKFAIAEIGSEYPTMYTVSHDGTGNDSVIKGIRAIQKFYGFSSKDAYNSSDLYIVKKQTGGNFLKKINATIERDGAKKEKDAVLSELNAILYDEYKNKNIYPISLKKIEEGYHKEYTNIPDEDHRRLLNFVECSCSCNLYPDTKEFGLMTFTTSNVVNGVTIRPEMQFKGYPDSVWGKPQCEITRVGVNTGGRIGKVPAYITGYILRTYGKELKQTDIGNFERGAYMCQLLNANKTGLSQFGREMYNKYMTVSVRCKKRPITEAKFLELMQMINDGLDEKGNPVRNHGQRAINVMYSLLGMNFLYTILFPIKDTTNNVITDLYYGAKKESPLNGFFIKVY